MATFRANVTGVDGAVTIYNLSDKNPFRVISATGIGNADIRRLEERGPFQEGVTDVGYRVDPRIITLTIQIYGTSASDIDTQRDLLGSIFSPVSSSPVRLHYTRDDSTVRQIDCYTLGMMDMPAQLPSRILNSQRVVVQLKAPSPIWYDPVIKTTSFTATPSDTTWYTGGGLIGTANVVVHRESVAEGAQDILPSVGGGTFTIMFRSKRPTSGTAAAWDIRQENPANRAYSFTARGSADFTATKLSSNYSGTGYTDTLGSVIAWRAPSSGIDRISQTDADGEATTMMQIPHGQWGLGTITWRRNFSGGSAWGNTMSHAAAYNFELSDEQLQAVALLMETPAAPVFLGTANLAGTWDDYPIISITGPIDNPSVTNMATGDQIAFAGTIASGDRWIIDTRYGSKSVTTQAGANIIDKVSDAADLATFRLRPGVNPIRIGATGGTTSTTEVSVTYYDRYLSS